jgi:short-subunit dehydrogenase
MRRQGRGHIVNVSSLAGKVAVPYLGIYSATKHALAAVSDALRSELAGTGVGVSSVYPGITDTGFQEHMLREVAVPEPPSYVPTAHAAVVARRIAQAVRWNLRDVYVTLADLAAVSAYPLAPSVADWAVRRLWLTATPSPEVEGAPPLPADEAGEPSAADTSEPPAEPGTGPSGAQ